MQNGTNEAVLCGPEKGRWVELRAKLSDYGEKCMYVNKLELELQDYFPVISFFPLVLNDLEPHFVCRLPANLPIVPGFR